MLLVPTDIPPGPVFPTLGTANLASVGLLTLFAVAVVVLVIVVIRRRKR
jgi:hypothetical protein